MPNNELHKYLRKSLNHFYNPDYLRDCPLASLLGVAGRFNTPNVLQGILTQAIEDMKLKPGGARDEKKIFYYDLLYYRYVQKLSQEEVAIQVGVSPRQFAREQDHAIDFLATILTEQYPSLAGMWTRSSETEQTPERPSAESEWLEKNSTGQAVSIASDFEIVLNLVSPMAHQNQVKIEPYFDPRLPSLAIHPVVFRQVLLSVINVAIHQAGKKKVVIKANELGQRVEITIQAERIPTAAAPEENAEDHSSLEMAKHLVQVNKGSLEIRVSEDRFTGALSLPAIQYHQVLLVDDNLDFHQLIERYVYGTRYQVISTKDPSQAIELSIKHSVQFIILDVMMPDIDGWQVLSQLRRNPRTSDIPVIICTIVAQEELAYSLGAKAFLHKPLTREALIETLDRLSIAGGSESG